MTDSDDIVQRLVIFGQLSQNVDLKTGRGIRMQSEFCKNGSTISCLVDSLRSYKFGVFQADKRLDIIQQQQVLQP